MIGKRLLAVRRPLAAARHAAHALRPCQLRLTQHEGAQHTAQTSRTWKRHHTQQLRHCPARRVQRRLRQPHRLAQHLDGRILWKSAAWARRYRTPLQPLYGIGEGSPFGPREQPWASGGPLERRVAAASRNAWTMLQHLQGSHTLRVHGGKQRAVATKGDELAAGLELEPLPQRRLGRAQELRIPPHLQLEQLRQV
eukprot:scaffold19521_cov77-Phaeocystis_antarctica.AAC.2